VEVQINAFRHKGEDQQACHDLQHGRWLVDRDEQNGEHHVDQAEQGGKGASGPGCDTSTFETSLYAVFLGFYASYVALQLGLANNWYKIPTDQIGNTVAVYLICWLVAIVMLTLARSFLYDGPTFSLDSEAAQAASFVDELQR